MSRSRSRYARFRVRRATSFSLLFVGVLTLATVGLVVGSAPAGAPVFKIVISVQAPGHQGLPAGVVGKPYSAHFSATGGVAPVHWKLASGKLPAGLKLNPKTGAITGKPTKKGAYHFVVQANDSRVPPDAARLSAAITIK